MASRPSLDGRASLVTRRRRRISPRCRHTATANRAEVKGGSGPGICNPTGNGVGRGRLQVVIRAATEAFCVRASVRRFSANLVSKRETNIFNGT